MGCLRFELVKDCMRLSDDGLRDGHCGGHLHLHGPRLDNREHKKQVVQLREEGIRRNAS